jgi:toxin-antitoxin system PIN domain toxin
MVLLDVNILVRAFREDAPQHSEFKAWLDGIASAEDTFGLSDLALSGFLRIVTHPRIFDPPTPTSAAIEFAETVRAQPNCLSISPGERHWPIFKRLCLEADARGNLVPDAYFAALAIESGSEWITTDLDFSRFEGLKWRHPLK